jgi:hypothetical protein
MFGAEGSAEGYVDAGKWIDFARDFGALIVCLEHRFYGQSFPTLFVQKYKYIFYGNNSRKYVTLVL